MRVVRHRGLIVLALVVVVAGVLWLRLGPWHAPSEQALVPASPDNQGTTEVTKDVATKPTDLRVDPDSGQEPDTWKSEYLRTHDYAAFVSTAAKAASAGDGNAAWYVGEAIAVCGGVIKFRGETANAKQAYMKAHTYPTTPPDRVAMTSALFDQCIGLAQSPEFVDWQVGKGGKMSVQYWRDRALELGEPSAKAAYVIANIAVVQTVKSPEERAQLKQQLTNYSRDVVRSKDPDAIFQLGNRMINGDIAREPTFGFAMALAACDLGYDCSAQNKQNYWSDCASSGRCPADQDFPGIVKQALGDRRYALAYARAQEFKDLLARDAWDELDAFVKLDGALLK